MLGVWGSPCPRARKGMICGLYQHAHARRHATAHAQSQYSAMTPATHTAATALLLALLATAAALLNDNQNTATKNVFLPDFTENCVACLCDASSACNLTIGCFAGLCGPFLIGRQYWLDAGAPVLPGATWQTDNAYESCTMDPNCATSTIFNYMTRFIKDCNGDGRVSCDDYARIHYLGGNQCSVPIKNYAYYRIFQQCMADINKQGTP